MSFFNSKIELTKAEEKVFNVIRELLLSDETLIEIEPLTFDYLLSHDRLQYYVLIDSEGVQISNHKFFLTRRLRNNVLGMLKKEVQIETTKRRKTKIDNIFNNELLLLQNITDQIKGNISQ